MSALSIAVACPRCRKYWNNCNCPDDEYQDYLAWCREEETRSVQAHPICIAQVARLCKECGFDAMAKQVKKEKTMYVCQSAFNAYVNDLSRRGNKEQSKRIDELRNTYKVFPAN